MIYAVEDIRLEEEKALLDRLPDWRYEEAIRYKHIQGRVASAQAYILLCRVLEDEYGIKEQPRFVRDEHGKPSLVEYNLYFNISHCGRAVAVVVDEHPCGIDVEAFGRYKEDLARYTMNPAECEAILHSDNPDRMFTCLWTQKEAVCKAQGTGITDNMKHVLIQKTYQIQTYTEETYALSIAYMGD